MKLKSSVVSNRYMLIGLRKIFYYFIFLIPLPALAGPICSGFFDCLPFTITVWAYSVLPWATLTFIVLILLCIKILHIPSTWWLWILVAIVSVFAAHFTVFSLEEKKYENEYQQYQSEEAQSLSFELYEPTYVVPGYELVEISADGFQDKLHYWYFDRATQQSSETAADQRYSVVIESLTDNPTILPVDKLILSINIGSTTASVSGTISESEGEKVLSSLENIEAKEIKFYSDWSANR